MQSIKGSKQPKILVVSNNPFSKTSSNGKTLASFFQGFPLSDIAQLYFSSEEPDFDLLKNYYQISDEEIVNSLLTSKRAGGKVTDTSIPTNSYRIATIHNREKSDAMRLMREMIWKSKKWQSRELMAWVLDFSPDIIFFCAGDAGFSYDITEEIVKVTGAKMITYLTDDYILPREKTSLSWRIRRNMILKRLRATLAKTDLFVTISEEMRKEYRTLFNKDSLVALNMTESMKLAGQKRGCDKNTIQLIYAGGLHLKRNETLKELAKAIQKFNQVMKDKSAFLSIYSNDQLDEKVLKALNVDQASAFRGGLDLESLKIKLNAADIPVHVESFDPGSIESTKLSISTKIPEYLSLGKPVLAIGPSTVASMKYLKESAYCVTNIESLYDQLVIFLEDEALQKELSVKSKETFIKNHDSKKTREAFFQEIKELLK